MIKVIEFVLRSDSNKGITLHQSQGKTVCAWICYFLFCHNISGPLVAILCSFLDGSTNQIT